MATANTKRNKNTEANQLYNTPEIGLTSFYNQFPEVFDSYSLYFDPCNGLGKISNYLKNLGKDVITSDLIDYGDQDFVANFLELEELPSGVDCIIFNPPFTLTKEFIDHAYYLANKAYNKPAILMFNRLTTLESKARSKKFKSGEWNLSYCYVFGFRVSCTEGVEEKATANSVSYAWYEFETGANYSITPALEWIV